MLTLYRVSLQFTFQISHSDFLTLWIALFELREPEFKAFYVQTVIAYFHIDVPRMPKNVPQSVFVISCSGPIPIS